MNESKELLAKIDNLLEFLKSSRNISFANDFYVTSKKDQESLNNFAIPYEQYEDILRIKFKNYFSPVNNIYAPILFAEIESDDINKDFLVIDVITKSFIYYNGDSKVLSTFGVKNIVLADTINNTVSYYSLFNFLRSKDFSDYFNDANNEIIIYSSAIGIFKIKYDTKPSLKSDKLISQSVQNLIEFATPIELRPFFKIAIFTVSNKTGIISINEIILKANDIVAITKRDFELVSKKFDFENFRNSLYKEKEKYFSDIRNVIDKIFSQAIGIPISIATSVFASYQISNNVLILILIILAFITYILFYLKIQFVYRSEVKQIDVDFRRDFNVIEISSGLSSETINSERDKIENKIKSTLSISCWLISVVIILGLLVSAYIGYEIKNSYEKKKPNNTVSINKVNQNVK